MVPKKHSWRRWQVQGPPRSHLAFNPSPPRPSRPPCPPNPRPHGASLAGVGGRGGASDGNSGACTILVSLWVRTARPPLSFAGAGKGQGSNRSCSCWPSPQSHWIRACICDLHHSLRQRRILNPLRRVEPASSQRQCQVLNPLCHNGNSGILNFILTERTLGFI